MNTSANQPSQSYISVVVNAISVVGIFLIMSGLIALMYYYTQPPPEDHAHWTERKRNLTELNAQNRDLLENYGWMDKNRGVVRLPIGRAMELTVQEWRNPAAARSNLLARLQNVVPVVVPATASSNAPGGKKP